VFCLNEILFRLPLANVSTVCKLSTPSNGTLWGFKTIYQKFGVKHFFTGGWGILISKSLELLAGFAFANGMSRYFGVRNGFSYWIANMSGAVAVYPITMALNCVRDGLLHGEKLTFYGVLQKVYSSPLGFKGLYSGLIPWCLSHIVYSVTFRIIEEILDRIENWLHVSKDLDDVDNQPEKVTTLQQLKIISWFFFIKIVRPVTLIGLVAPFEYLALNYQVSALKGGNEVVKRGFKILLEKNIWKRVYSSFFGDFLLMTLFK